MKQLLTLILGISALSAASITLANSCDDPNLIVCLHYTVSDQPIMHGHYVKFETNGKPYPTGVLCLSDDSSWGFESDDVAMMMNFGLIKLGDNTATSTQCSNKSCDNHLASVQYKFTLSKDSDHYKATPSRAQIALQAFGEACTVQPPMKHFK